MHPLDAPSIPTHRSRGRAEAVTIIYVLLVAHFVGDFLCQTDWMALNKSKRLDALALHVGVYIGVVAFIYFLFLKQILFTDAADGWAFIAVNAVAHFVQDAITSRINARLWQANQRHWFFVGIGADQLLHYVTLFVTAGWWLQ